MVNRRKARIAIALNASILMPMLAVLVAVIAAPTVTAAGSCDVPASNPPGMSQYFEEHSLEDGSFWEDWGFGDWTDLKPLKDDFSVDMTISNDSANAVRMELIPGYQYTFCISMSPDPSDEPEMGAVGDVYLMDHINWDRYSMSYENREWDDLESLVEEIPVEWRDTLVWLPYRDVHAYEGVSDHVFSVAIDSMGSAWSSVGWFSSTETQYYLVIDGWDNEKFSDRGAAGGTINVEVLVDVEERTTLPNFIAYILISALPIACIIGPLIIHSRYMKMGLSDEEESRQMAYLDNEGDQRSGEED